MDHGVPRLALVVPSPSGAGSADLDLSVASRGGCAYVTVSGVADLAVAMGCGQLKSGAPARGERVAKHNRLRAIEAESGAPYGVSTMPAAG